MKWTEAVEINKGDLTVSGPQEGKADVSKLYKLRD
jgi:hypothetical protein